MSKTVDRLLVLGLMATWSVLDPMRSRGLMPNLDALLSGAAHGTLRSIIPPVTMAAWTTMFDTRLRLRRGHGVFDHRYYDAAEGRMKVNHSPDPRAHCMAPVQAPGDRSVLLNSVDLSPIKVNGISVSGMDAPHLQAALSAAPEFASRSPAEAPTTAWATSEASPAISRRAHEQRQADRPELPRPCRRRLARRTESFPTGRCSSFSSRTWTHSSTGSGPTSTWMKQESNGRTGTTRRPRSSGASMKQSPLRLRRETRGGRDGRERPRLRPLAWAASMSIAFWFRPASPDYRAGAGLIGRRTFQAGDRLRLWGQKRDNPKARSSLFDQSVTAQYPLIGNSTLAFAPHQDTAAMVYVNARPAMAVSKRRPAPKMTPRQIDDARLAAVRAQKQPSTPRPLGSSEDH